MGREDRINSYSNYYNYYSSEGGGGEATAAGMKMWRRKKKKKEADQASGVPTWLAGLMKETFFGSCGIHEERRKNEKNVFCLLCCHSICPHCLPASHHSHPFLQSYTINSAKVIFVNERAQSRSGSGSGSGSGSRKAASANNICFTCDRILQHPFHFCSLSCKVNHMVGEGEELGSILVMGGGGAAGSLTSQVVASTEDMAFSQFEGLRMDSSEITDDDELGVGGGDDGQLFMTTTNNSSSSNHSSMPMAPDLYPSSVTDHDDDRRYYPIRESDPSDQLGPQRQKKKKHGPSSTGGFLQAGIKALSFGSRRKSAPHRAPLS